ncbi:hypothetical protein [uncultured Albimonas sp.]|uniref:hypothetical protein n=1 Tax=uncultured Albimonas sp. TaxID=1331701 RepID=UPI0030EE3899|tara:strand:+ start:1328 stop:1492 length:165 start_codon:yes stop_codon:yes gene_type:complete
MSRILLILTCLALSACASPARDVSREIVRIRLAEAPPACAPLPATSPTPASAAV